MASYGKLRYNERDHKRRLNMSKEVNDNEYRKAPKELGFKKKILLNNYIIENRKLLKMLSKL